jgi:hypothetical protein
VIVSLHYRIRHRFHTFSGCPSTPMHSLSSIAVVTLSLAAV